MKTQEEWDAELEKAREDWQFSRWKYSWYHLQVWRDEALLEMADELNEVLIGKWYFDSGDNHLELWTPTSASAFDSWSNYAGEDMSDYYACVACTRDSDEIQESNFRVAKAMFQERLGDESDETWLVGGWNHWACGWIDRILIHKNCWKGIRLGNEIGEMLESCSILNEEDLSELQYENYEKYVKGELPDEKDRQRFYRLVGNSRYDCGTVDTLDEELLDEVKNKTWLIPLPSGKFEDDGGEVWEHIDSSVLRQCRECGDTEQKGYITTSSIQEFICDDCVRIDEDLREHDKNQLDLFTEREVNIM